MEANEIYLNELKEIHKAMKKEIDEMNASLVKKEDEYAEFGAKILRTELELKGIKAGVTIVEYFGDKGIVRLKKRDRYFGVSPYYQYAFVKIKKNGLLSARSEIIFMIEDYLKRGTLKITNEEYNKEELA